MTEKKPPEETATKEENATLASEKPNLKPPAAVVPPKALAENEEQEEVTEIKALPTAAAPAVPPAKPNPSPQITPTPPPLPQANANQLLENITAPLIVELGRISLTISGIGELKTGSIIELSKTPSDTVDLVVAGKSIGKGELVDVEGDLGVRIISLVK